MHLTISVGQQTRNNDIT